MLDFLLTEPIVQSFSVNSFWCCILRVLTHTVVYRYGVVLFGAWYIASWSM